MTLWSHKSWWNLSQEAFIKKAWLTSLSRVRSTCLPRTRSASSFPEQWLVFDPTIKEISKFITVIAIGKTKHRQSASRILSSNTSERSDISLRHPKNPTDADSAQTRTQIVRKVPDKLVFMVLQRLSKLQLSMPSMLSASGTQVAWCQTQSAIMQSLHHLWHFFLRWRYWNIRVNEIDGLFYLCRYKLSSRH